MQSMHSELKAGKLGQLSYLDTGVSALIFFNTAFSSVVLMAIATPNYMTSQLGYRGSQEPVRACTWDGSLSHTIRSCVQR